MLDIEEKLSSITEADAIRHDGRPQQPQNKNQTMMMFYMENHL